MYAVQHIRNYFREPAARWGRTFLLAATVGVLSGLAAAGLEYLLHSGVEHIIGRITPLSGGQILPRFDWRILLLPAAGGLVGGLIVTWLASDHEHGTNQMIAAFHRYGGNLPLIEPVLKALAAVGMIVCGGSAGPEGPIAAVGAGIGSTVARRLKLSARTVRSLLLAGCAGGVGAIFRCPLGGALFATSVLYREPEFESESIVPALVASVVSYSTFMAFWGYGHHLLAGADRLVFAHPAELLAYLMLGVICGLLAGLLSLCLHLVERPVHRFKLPNWAAATAGGLLVGAVACFVPQVMDAQYQFLQRFMDARQFGQGTFLMSDPVLPDGVLRSCWAWAGVLGLVAVLKCLASALTVGTAGAGGLLGPSVFIGGAGGAFLAALIEAIEPGAMPEDMRRSLVAAGMAGVLSAAMRTPMAAIVMVTEMTGSYGLIVPLMLVCVTSYVIGKRWGLNTAQVRSAAESPAHAGDALVHMLESYRVRDVMEANWPYSISSSTSLGEMVAMMRTGTRPVFAVVDGQRLAGIVSISDISRMLEEPGIADIVIASDMMTSELSVIHPTQGLYEVLEGLRTSGHEVLPVVSQDGRAIFLGMLSRQGIHEVVRNRVGELNEHLRREHAAVAAIQQDEQLYQLVLGIPTQGPETVYRMPVPGDVVGRSLRAADFRQRFGVQVIAIQGQDGKMQCPPDIDAPLTRDQLLLVIGMP